MKTYCNTLNTTMYKFKVFGWIKTTQITESSYHQQNNWKLIKIIM